MFEDFQGVLVISHQYPPADEVKEEARVEVEEVEGGDVDYLTRIKIIMNEELKIKQEMVSEWYIKIKI